MPRFFFDVLEHGQMRPDSLGLEFETAAFARVHAVDLLYAISEANGHGENAIRIDVRDERGDIVSQASFEHPVSPEPAIIRAAA